MIVRVADSYLVLDSLSLQSSPKLGSHGELMQKLRSRQSSVTFGDIVEVDALHSQKKSLLLFLRGSNVNVLYNLSVWMRSRMHYCSYSRFKERRMKSDFYPCFTSSLTLSIISIAQILLVLCLSVM